MKHFGTLAEGQLGLQLKRRLLGAIVVYAEFRCKTNSGIRTSLFVPTCQRQIKVLYRSGPIGLIQAIPLLSTSVTRVTRFEIVASGSRIINARNLRHALCLSVVEVRQGKLFLETEELLQAVRVA